MTILQQILLYICAASSLFILWWLLSPPAHVEFKPLEVLKHKIYASDMDKITYAIRMIFGRMKHQSLSDQIGRELAPYSAIDVYEDDPQMLAAKGMQLPICIGKDYDHKLHFADLAKMPHVLIAGLTGFGKSMCFQNFIYWLGKSKNSVEVHAIDPKQTGFSRFIYSEKPPIKVVFKDKEYTKMLDSLVHEMNDRNALMRELSFKDISDYNATIDDKLPYIVLLIDEFQDLERKQQDGLKKLARKGRSAGIHLVLGTQNPNGNDIDPTILQQLAGIVSFRLRNKEASKRILGQAGAEKLVGKGEMVFKSATDLFAGRTPLAELKDFDFYGKYLAAQAAKIAEFKDKKNAPKRGRPKKHNVLP